MDATTPSRPWPTSEARPPIRGGSDGDSTRTERTIDKTRGGTLPAQGAVKVTVRPGSSKVCSGCDEPITDEGREFGVEMSDAVTFRFHAECHAAWITFSGGQQRTTTGSPVAGR
jgi:hypothetical protein